ncbi:hypothetical protein PAALTS15_03472 [Paenibacillus alvei TS-15]|uniref:Uncharacterized protein n=1 Tax=Paenibacillus alvei TS-15 TaxID=1117108 RepID=S9SSD1_PAEAL|nr:hypothetical protein [Paenibacillus alvei]EPY08602.1 hypothetical protein PAALTS15_03472 [Paenibacillus alvei TS-15]
MTKNVWKANQVISIETRWKDEGRKNNVYVLAQMISKAQLLIFDLYSDDNSWGEVNLNDVPILFSTSVTRQFIKHSNIYKQSIKPLTNYKLPTYKIESLGMGSRHVTVWKGTTNERKVLMLGQGGGRLIEEDMSTGSYKTKIIMPSIPVTDSVTIDKYELTNVRVYPEFNERLYLCYKFGKNVDPMKDLIFDRPIPLEYKDYIDIISS